MNENHGLIFVEPTEQDYKQHGPVRLGGAVLVPDGQWDGLVPIDEVQNLAMEPYACTAFGTLNCIEALERQEFGTTSNWSDRFLAWISETKVGGNDPHKVAETLRKKGTVPEIDWPYTSEINTWEKFYLTPPYEIEVKAQVKFRGKFDFGHEWKDTDPDSMMEALKYSPLAVDVYAWSPKNAKGYYTRQGQSGHWTMIYGYVKDKYWKCFDSYSNTHKKLAWDFGFTMVKGYTLHKKVLGNTLWDKAIIWLRDNLNWI